MRKHAVVEVDRDAKDEVRLTLREARCRLERQGVKMTARAIATRAILALRDAAGDRKLLSGDAA